MRVCLVAVVLPWLQAVRVPRQRGHSDTEQLDGQQAFLESARRIGIQGVEHLRFRLFEKGPDKVKVRGLTTSRDHKKGEVLMVIPEEVQLFSRGRMFIERLRAIGAPEKVLQLQCTTDACDRIRMSAALITLKHSKGHQWDAYIAQLPSWEDFKAYHPAAAAPSLLQRFEGLPAVQTLRALRNAVKKHFEQYRDLGGPGTWEDWLWAETLLMSYSWGQEGGLVMAPLADSLNYAPPAEQNIAWQDTKNGTGILLAYTDIPAGTELTEEYDSSQSADGFFDGWGFVQPTETPPLESNICKELMGVVGSSLKSSTSACSVPEAEAQPGIFCSFSRLSLMHCP